MLGSRFLSAAIIFLFFSIFTTSCKYANESVKATSSDLSDRDLLPSEAMCAQLREVLVAGQYLVTIEREDDSTEEKGMLELLDYGGIYVARVPRFWKEILGKKMSIKTVEGIIGRPECQLFVQDSGKRILKSIGTVKFNNQRTGLDIVLETGSYLALEQRLNFDKMEVPCVIQAAGRKGPRKFVKKLRVNGMAQTLYASNSERVFYSVARSYRQGRTNPFELYLSHVSEGKRATAVGMWSNTKLRTTSGFTIGCGINKPIWISKNWNNPGGDEMRLLCDLKVPGSSSIEKILRRFTVNGSKTVIFEDKKEGLFVEAIDNREGIYELKITYSSNSKGITEAVGAGAGTRLITENGIDVRCSLDSI